MQFAVALVNAEAKAQQEAIEVARQKAVEEASEEAKQESVEVAEQKGPIQCLTLIEIIQKHVGMPTFLDVFSLDVEGAELDEYLSIYFSQVDFGVIFAEQDGRSKKKRNRSTNLVRKQRIHTFRGQTV